MLFPRAAKRRRVANAQARPSLRGANGSKQSRNPDRQTGLRRFARNDDDGCEQKRKRNAGRRTVMLRALGRGARSADRARLSAFHHGFGLGAFGPLQARLPRTRQERAIQYTAPTGEQRSFASYAGVTRARLSQSRVEPPGPVVVPASMMPGANRGEGCKSAPLRRQRALLPGCTRPRQVGGVVGYAIRPKGDECDGASSFHLSLTS